MSIAAARVKPSQPPAEAVRRSPFDVGRLTGGIVSELTVHPIGYALMALVFLLVGLYAALAQ